MRVAFATLALLLLLSGTSAAQTSSTSEPTTGDDPYDEGGDGAPRGAAGDGPALGGIIIGLLVIAVLALVFAGYMRYR